MCHRNHKSTITKQGKCSECIRINSRNWRKSNIHKHNEYQRQYRIMDFSKIKKLLENKEEIYFTSAYRKKKRIIVATPDSADHSEIRRIYEECVRHSSELNIELEVDHTIPIFNKNVCGLHVPDNLRVVSHNLNTLKGNKFNRELASVELFKWLKERNL